MGAGGREAAREGRAAAARALGGAPNGRWEGGRAGEERGAREGDPTAPEHSWKRVREREAGIGRQSEKE